MFDVCSVSDVRTCIAQTLEDEALNGVSYEVVHDVAVGQFIVEIVGLSFHDPVIVRNALEDMFDRALPMNIEYVVRMPSERRDKGVPSMILVIRGPKQTRMVCSDTLCRCPDWYLSPDMHMLCDECDSPMVDVCPCCDNMALNWGPGSIALAKCRQCGWSGIETKCEGCAQPPPADDIPF